MKELSAKNKNLRSQIEAFCEEKKGEMVNLLQKLVSIPSESNSINNETEILAKFLKHKLEEHEIRSIIRGRGDSITVQGTFGYKSNGILLNCPLDTAPAGDLNKWTHPPYDGIIKEGKMFGRGTADAKSGIVSMIYAVLALKEFVNENQIRVELIFDGGEHDGTYSGMHTALDSRITVDAGIIGYAGNMNEMAIGARGYHRYLFTSHGKAVHTGSRFKPGVNAISKMVKFIAKLEEIELPKPTHNQMFDFGSRLTFSLIEGGTAINIVPDECRAQLDIRTTPEQTKEDVENLIKKTIQELKKQDKEFEIDYKYTVGEDGYMLKGNEKIISALKCAIEDTIKEKPTIVVSGPAHIGNLLYKHNIPVVIRGPEGDNIHSYNEYVKIDSLPIAAEIYAKAVLCYFDFMPPTKEKANE